MPENNPTPLTARQLEILQHALGWDKYGQGHSTRNHYCAGYNDEPACRELVELGYMKQHETPSWLPYFNCSVTPEGRRVASEQSPKPPKLTRSQKRYRCFLRHDSGLSFREWLTYYGKEAV